MKLEIPTSPAVAEKIKNLFEDKVLKPKNMKLIHISVLSHDTHVVKIDWQHGELAEIFFLGYWTSHVANKKINTTEIK
jgi:hypothetical protein